MKDREFYAYCRDQRKTEPNAHRKAALIDVYNFMRECTYSRNAVRRYLTETTEDSEGNQGRVDAYQWVQGVLDGPVGGTVASQQATLF